MNLNDVIDIEKKKPKPKKQLKMQIENPPMLKMLLFKPKKINRKH